MADKAHIASRARGFWSEFRRFAIKGNAIELAIAVVIGNAFTGIVNSLVADIITPLIGFVTGNVDFKMLTLALRPDLVIKYGSFLQAVFNFLVISFSIFLMFKALASARERLFRKEEKEAPPPEQKPEDVRLLEEIRDLLKARS
jgi:large conductance mechanosensitive channel